MRAFHERLARIGLATTERYGFVLAGGYALAAHGFGNRPSMDIDLFTRDMSPENFARAVTELRAAYEAADLAVDVLARADLFVNIDVHDPHTGESSEIQLGYDYREFPPARLDIGPVLDEKDAVANKLAALFSRGEVRDFIDIDTVIQSGRFSREDVLALEDTRESQPIDRRMLAQRFRTLTDPQMGVQYGASQFDSYHVDAATRAAIIARFTQWAAEIDAARVDQTTPAAADHSTPRRKPSAPPAPVYENDPRTITGSRRSPQVRRPRQDRGPRVDR